jgi:acyl-homoserine lactone acylase PvdQ
MIMRRRIGTLLSCIVVIAAVALPASTAPGATSSEVTITFTEHGIPHIKAANF